MLTALVLCTQTYRDGMFLNGILLLPIQNENLQSRLKVTINLIVGCNGHYRETNLDLAHHLVTNGLPRDRLNDLFCNQYDLLNFDVTRVTSQLIPFEMSCRNMNMK